MVTRKRTKIQIPKYVLIDYVISCLFCCFLICIFKTGSNQLMIFCAQIQIRRFSKLGNYLAPLRDRAIVLHQLIEWHSWIIMYGENRIWICIIPR